MQSYNKKRKVPCWREVIISLIATIACNAQLFVPVPPLLDFYGPDGWANALREYEVAQINAFLHGRGRESVVTSANRTNSPAHSEGAVDYSSKDLSTDERHAEAQSLSTALGPDFTVIVEEGVHPADAPPYRTLTSYVNGQRVSVRRGGFEATHTHVQRSNQTTPQALADKLHLTPTHGSLPSLTALFAPQWFANEPPTNWNVLNIPNLPPDFFAKAIVEAIARGAHNPHSACPVSSGSPVGGGLPNPAPAPNQSSGIGPSTMGPLTPGNAPPISFPPPSVSPGPLP